MTLSPSPKVHFFSIVIIFFLFLFSVTASAQSNMFDPQFGNGGIVKTKILAYSSVFKILKAKNDKILAIGFAGDGGVSKLSLVRYNKDGGVDSSFGQNGIAIHNIVTSFNWDIGGASQDADYRIIVCGYTFDSALNFAPFIIRFLENGNIDNSFSSTGITGDKRALNLVVKPNNKILLAVTGDKDSLTLTQLNANGGLDKSFGINGVSRMRLAPAGIARMQLLKDNSLILGEAYTNIDATISGAGLGKINDMGEIDSTFGNNGSLYIFNNFYLGCLTADASGRLIITGEFTPTVDESNIIGMERLLSNGKPDSTFGVNGLVITRYKPSGASIEDNVINDIALQQDGHIYLGGRNHPVKGTSNFLVVKYNSNGSLDNSFGDNGIVSDKIDSSYSVGATLLVQDDGKPVISGTAGPRGAQLFLLARYRNSNILPLTLLSFTGESLGKKIMLNWKAANQTDVSYYAIERSFTATGFTEIGRVSSNRSNPYIQQYQFTDAGFNTGKNFYRLKMVDKNGHYTYSNIILINPLATVSLKAYPNPVMDNLIIEGLNMGESVITITDETGRTLQHSTVKGESAIYNISSLASGVYFVTISTGNQKKSFKIVKK